MVLVGLVPVSHVKRIFCKIHIIVIYVKIYESKVQYIIQVFYTES